MELYKRCLEISTDQQLNETEGAELLPSIGTSNITLERLRGY